MCVCTYRDHVTRADGKGHSDMRTKMGRGAKMSTSKKLEVEKHISTETEILFNGERFIKCT